MRSEFIFSGPATGTIVKSALHYPQNDTGTIANRHRGRTRHPQTGLVSDPAYARGDAAQQPSPLHCCRPPPALPTVAPPAIVSSVIDLPLHSSGRLQIDAALLCCLLPDRAFHRGEPHTGVVGEGVRRARAGDWRASRAMGGLRRSGRAARAGGSGSARTPGSHRQVKFT